jgi:hypothetical protein
MKNQDRIGLFGIEFAPRLIAKLDRVEFSALAKRER